MKKPKKGAEATPGSAVAQLGRSTNYQAFAEADAVNGESREVDVVIITEGPGNAVDKHYYSEQAIRSGVKKWDGARAFLNHQTESEEEARPEQSVREQCGFYHDTKLVRVYDPSQLKMVWGIGAKFVPERSQEGAKALALVEAQLLWNKLYPSSPECYAGISVSTGGWSDGTVEINGEDWINVTAFENVRSADFVTRPARGGAFLRLAESMSPVGDTTLEPQMKNALKVKKLLASIEESDKKAASATKTEDKKRLLQESKRLKAELTKILESAVEAEDEGAAEAAEDEGGEEPDGDEPMAALMKHFPKQDGEEDEAYKARVRQAMQAAAEALGAGESEDEDGEDDGEEARPAKQSKRTQVRESAMLRTFKREQPALYRELTTNLRESLSAERHDFKGLKESNTILQTRIKKLELERDLSEATKKLAKAGIPKKYLAPADLIKMDEAAQQREIDRTLLIMEGAGAVPVWAGESARGGSEADGLDLVAAGLPVKANEE